MSESLLLTIVEKLLAYDPVDFSPEGGGPDLWICRLCCANEPVRHLPPVPGEAPRLFGRIEGPSHPFPHDATCAQPLAEEAGRRFLGWSPPGAKGGTP